MWKHLICQRDNLNPSNKSQAITAAADIRSDEQHLLDQFFTAIDFALSILLVHIAFNSEASNAPNDFLRN